MSEKIALPIVAELHNHLEQTPAGRLLMIFIDFKKNNKEELLTLGVFKKTYAMQDHEGFAEAAHYLMETGEISIGRSAQWTVEQITTLPDDLLVEPFDATAA